MKRVLLIIIIGLFLTILVSAAENMEDNLYYNFKLNYDTKKGVDVSSPGIEFFNTKPVNILDNRNNDAYKLEVLDFSGNIIEKIEFSLLNKYFYDVVNESGDFIDEGVEKSDNSSFDVYAPYHYNAKEIVIYDSLKKEVARKDVSEFSKTRIDESGKIENVVKENIDEETGKKIESKNVYGIVGLICVIVLLIAGFVVWKRKK